jgi:hypothetical protein
MPSISHWRKYMHQKETPNYNKKKVGDTFVYTLFDKKCVRRAAVGGARFINAL